MKSMLLLTALGCASLWAAVPAALHLRTNQYEITVHISAKQPLYTVKDLNGNLVGEQMHYTELKAKAPEAYEFVTAAIAQGTLDASVSPEYQEPKKAKDTGKIDGF